MTNVLASHISRRAQNLQTDCKFALSGTVSSNPQWEIQFGHEAPQFQTDRILTLHYSHISADVLETIFFESICRLSQGKTLNFLFLLSFREIESFLRDENHIPAFDNVSEAQAQDVFGHLKNALVLKILAAKISSPAGKRWSGLSLSDKNRAVLELFTSLCALFPKEKNLELILAEDTTVTVKKNDFPLELEAVETLLNHLFLSGEADSPLKVIGTL